MSAPTSQRTPSEVIEQVAQQQVTVPQPDEVRCYLETHRDLAELVPVICDRARREFGDQAELSLEIDRDPEIKDEHLVLYVRLSQYENSTTSRIDQTWLPYEAHLSQCSGFLLVTTDFRPPK